MTRGAKNIRVEDIYKVFGKEQTSQRYVMLGRICVLGVALVAGLLALNPSGTILELVGFAWAGFGAAFGPVILLSLYWPKLTAKGAMAGMIAGAAVVGIWGKVAALNGLVYEIVPGFIAGLLAAVGVSLMTQKSSDNADGILIREEFAAMLSGSGRAGVVETASAPR